MLHQTHMTEGIFENEQTAPTKKIRTSLKDARPPVDKGFPIGMAK